MEAKTSMESYDHKPFPDVSGLRTSASGRNGSFIVSQSLDAGIFHQIQDIEQTQGWETNTLITAAWGVLLAHYLSQEITDVAFFYSGNAVLHLRQADLCDQSALAICSAISSRISAFHYTHSDPSPYTKVDVSITWHADDDGHQDEQEAMRLFLRNQGCRLDLRASARVHNEASAQLYLGHFTTLIASFVVELTGVGSSSTPALSLKRFPSHLKAADNPSPHPITLADDAPLDQERFEGQFERWARRTPQAVALDFRHGLDANGARTELTYAELDHRANLVCDLLLASVPQLRGDHDAEPIVALCLDKSPELYIAQLGILKARAAWCPIDPDWPEQRKQALLDKSGASVVLTSADHTSEALRPILPTDMRQLRIDHVDWSRSEANLSSRISNNASPRASATQLAYKIWTSGTTGLPKAVGIEHKAAVQALRALQAAIPHQGPIRYLQFSAYVFDLSIMDCFYTWGLGGTICACPRELLLADLASVIRSFQATHTLLTPAVMALTPREQCPSLKVVINGGEKLTQVVADMWSVDCCLLNLYGPAEATLIAMQRVVPPNDDIKAPNIGVALPTVSCHALNRQLQPVPKGCIGQLALGGFQCARGYIGDEQKTSEKFVLHPELGRIYMTGDLVRQLSDGTFEYLGREDDQIKVNGIRIETLEISAIIRSSHTLIKDSETMALSVGNQEDVRIVNFSILPSQEPPASPADLLRVDTAAAEVARALRASAQDRLPSYMVPSLFIILSHFPKTSSNKIDRAALKNIMSEIDVPDWEAAISGGDGQEDGYSHESEAPSYLEKTIRSHVARLCSVDESRVGRHIPLPSLGIDSIRAMMLAKRLTEQGLSVSVVDIIRQPTIAKLSLHISSHAESTSDRLHAGHAALTEFDAQYKSPLAQHLGIATEAIEAVLPATPLQQGMLAETLRSKRRSAYWLNRVFRVEKCHALSDLKQACIAVFTKLPGCRTSFCDVSQLTLSKEVSSCLAGTFVQVVRRDVAAAVRVLEACENQGLQQVAQSLTGTSPLSGLPPLAVVMAPGRHVNTLLLRAHHSIYDARTLELLENAVQDELTQSASSQSLQSMAVAIPHILPLSEKQNDERKECWKDALQKVPTGLRAVIPQAGGRTCQKQREGRHHRLSLKLPAGWSRLSESARQLGTSARPIAQCAWASVLSAYTDTEWMILGDSIAGRVAGAGFENVFGPLHTTLAVPIQINSLKSRRLIVDEVDEFHKAVLNHQHVPLNLIRKQLGIAAQEPLFQSVFVFEASSQDRGDRLLQHSEDLYLSVEHPLAIEVATDGSEDLELGLVFDSDVWSETQASCLLHQFEASLQLFCTRPDDTPDCWDGIDTCLLSITIPTPSPLIDAAKDVAVEQWLFHHAQSQPDAVALEFWPSFDDDAQPLKVTYAALAQKVKQLAQILIAKFNPQSTVAVCLPRGVETYVALLAIQLSDMVYLPIDENLPLERKSLLIKDSGAVCLLTDSKLRRAVSDVRAVETIELDDTSLLAWPDIPSPTKIPNPPSNHLAYILYTSGSTGTPKGCRLTRANLAAAIEAFRLKYEQETPGSFKNGARFLARSAEAFDVALLETFLPLRTGSTIVTAPRHVILDDLRKSMSRSQVTHAAVVPSLFHSQGRPIKPEDLPSLRALIVGGEQISSAIVTTWGTSNVCTLNAYGPTEATIGVSMCRVLADVTTSNIGQPFSGSRFAVMQESQGKLRPVLRGQAGELCIIGPQVGAGYLNGRDESAFHTWEGQALYRTGDLARLTVDDEALYLGRLDDSQVKIRGARLELKEIDAVLSRAGQLQSVTFLSEVEGQQPAKLVSMVARRALLPAQAETAGKELQIDDTLADHVSELQQVARRELPGHMQPSTIVALQYLPLAPLSGKVDQSRLRQLYQDISPHLVLRSSESHAHPSRPLNDMEALLAEHFGAVVSSFSDLEGVPLQPSTDLFEAGLDSLSAISLVGRLKKAGLHISALDLMTHATIESAAKVCVSQQHGNKLETHDSGSDERALTAKAKMHGLSLGSVEKILPCTSMQQALVGQTLAAPSPLYISHIKAVLPADIDLSKFRNALDDAVAANPIWRTSFPELDGQLYQAVHLPGSQSFWMTHQEAGQDVQKLAQNIGTISPLRMYVKRNETNTKFLMLAHHALYDGVSLHLFLKEVEDRYHGLAVPVDRPSFENAVCAINETSLDDAAQFWRANLRGLSFTPFPELHSERLTPSNVRQELSHTARTSFSHLSSAARGLGTTAQALVIAAFSSLYTQYTGEQDSLFGLVLNGRNSIVDDAERVQGPLASTVPFRTESSHASPHATAHTRAVHQRLLELYRYQHSSLSQIGKWVNAEQSLFNTLLSYLPQQNALASTLFHELSAEMSTEFPLAVEVQPQIDGSLQLKIVFDPCLLPAEHAAIFLRQLDAEVQHYTDGLSPLIVGQESEDIGLYSACNPRPALPAPSDHFVSLFRQQAASIPQATAIEFASDSLDERLESITYSQLDQLSSRLAERILHCTSEATVAVHMGRSIFFYATILAVWKSGKTYLPLDPALPVERLQYMLDCVKARFIITDLHCRSRSELLSDDVFCPEGCQEAYQNGETPHEVEVPKLESVAYTLFTSGSTGKPKAVPVSHRALSAAILSWRAMLPHRKSSRMLQLASASFDVSLIEICMPLALGFTIVSAPKELLLEDLEQTFKRLRLTMADLPAALAATVHPGNVPKLEWLMSGGDAIDDRVLAEWAPHGLINAWGPTETTIGNTLGFVTTRTKRSLVGKAYPGSSVYVLKPAGRQLAFKGCLGELAVGGSQVAEGYLGQPELTAESFFTLEDGTPMYRTGDRGRILANGDVEVLGRISRGQVKVRGQRLELDEVSAALRSLETVGDADTLYVQHPQLPSKQLVAWISEKGANLVDRNVVQLRVDAAASVICRAAVAQVQSILPHYMVPSFVLASQKALPLTANNKVDHGALEVAFKSLSVDALRSSDTAARVDDQSVPLTPTETTIRKFVATFCGLPEGDIERTTSFHRLGIDSISALRLVRLLRDAGFPKIAVRDVMRWPSVAMLAQNAASQDSSGDRQTVSQAQALGRSLLGSLRTPVKLAQDELISALPCTPLQTGMLAQTVGSSDRLYFLSHPICLQRVRMQSLRRAWKLLVAKHDILRTTFHRTSPKSSWVQVVHTSTPTAFEDCTPLSTAELGGFVQRQRLDTTEEGLGKQTHRFIVSEHGGQISAVLLIHHALYDGRTISLMWDDLDAALAGYALPSRPPFHSLAPLLLPTESDTDFWARALEGHQQAFLPQAQDSMTLSSTKSYEARATIPMPIAKAKTQCRELDVGLRTVALFAFVRVLASLTSTRDVVTGEIFALRDIGSGAEDALGPIFNTVATRVLINPACTVAKVLKEMQDKSDQSRPHRRASLQAVHMQLGLLRAPFDTLFDYHIDEEEMQRCCVESLDVQEEPNIQYGLNVEFRQKSNAMEVFATAHHAYFNQAQLSGLVESVSASFVSSLNDSDRSADEVMDKLPLPAAVPHAVEEESLDTSHWETEKNLLRDAVAEVLSLDSTRLDDDTQLTLLGFDSISVLRLAQAARKRNLPLAVSDLVKGGTISGTVACMKDRTNGRGKSANTQRSSSVSPELQHSLMRKLNVSQDAIEDVLPALPGQIFQLARWLNSGKRTGMYSWVLRAHQALDCDKLQTTWRELRSRHSILRSTFASHEGRIYQIVLSEEASGASRDITWQQAEDLNVAAKDKLRMLAGVAHDLSTPAVSLHVIDSDSESAAILNLSHALYDAWTIERILVDLEQLYAGDGQQAENHFAGVALRSTESQQSLEAQRFWTEELSAADPCQILPQEIDPEVNPLLVYDEAAFTSVARYEHVRSRATSRSLPSLQYLFMAAWHLELVSISGLTQPVFGLYHSGRNTGEIDGEAVLRPTLNVLPFVGPANASDLSLSDIALVMSNTVTRQMPYVQSELAQICSWVKHETEPIMDTYLNIVWNRGSEKAPRTSSWSAVNLGNPTDFAPKHEISGATTIDDMSPSYLRTLGTALEVDVVLRPNQDHVGIGVRSTSSGFMDETALKGIIQRLANRVEEEVRRLEDMVG